MSHENEDCKNCLLGKMKKASNDVLLLNSNQPSTIPSTGTIMESYFCSKCGYIHLFTMKKKIE